MILAVTGLDREARIVARPGSLTLVAGSRGQALKLGIASAVAAGANRVLSIGICGALSPALKVGDCIVATEIVTHNERLPTDVPWTSDLLTAVPGARMGTLLGSDAIVADRDAKERLYRATLASGIDLESHIAARVARENGLAFAALRVVSDSSQQSLPPAAMVAMSPTGGIDVPAVIRSLFVQPGQIPALIRTAWEAEKAFRVLVRCSHVLDAAPDLGKLTFEVA